MPFSRRTSVGRNRRAYSGAVVTSTGTAVASFGKEMGKLDSEEASWLTKLKAVHASLESHIREEEQNIFPRISKVWDEKRLEHAGTAMKEMKAQKLKPATEAAPAKEAGGGMRKAG
jgi:hypothetical protein